MQPAPKRQPPFAARSAARLAAVQGLYSMEASGASPEQIGDEVRAGRLPHFEEGAYDGEIDLDLARRILEAVVAHQSLVDTEIAAALAKGWRLERLDAVARAILRTAVTELMAFPDQPTAVLVNEYVEIAKAFFDAPEPAFIHGVIDVAAKAVRGAGIG
jgi:N utilization substance protein B